VRAWHAELAAARDTCQQFTTGKRSLDQLARIAPVLIDSSYSAELDVVLGTLSLADVEAHPRLSFARGRHDLLRGDERSAAPLFARALSNAGSDAPLVARATWELGCLALREDHVSAAEIALQLGRGGLGPTASASADLLHLEALIAERRSQREVVVDRYRGAIGMAAGALTLLTRVIALRNLASAIAHDSPDEASALCALGLALVDADDLDVRARPALENVLAYSLLCAGKTEEALARADSAIVSARDAGHGLIECYASFNRCIALELLGRVRRSDKELANLTVRARKAGFPDVREWAHLRRAWLAFKQEPPDRVRDQLRHDLTNADAAPYAESVTTLRALLDYREGNATSAVATLAGLVEQYAANEDWLTSFVLLLWLACVHDSVGQSKEAAAAVHAGLQIGSSRSFRPSPNWWSDDLVRIAQQLASPDDAPYAARLQRPRGRLRTAPRARVTVLPDGNLEIDGRPISDERWRSGRTGSRVLRRLVSCLAAAHPVGVPREELMDILWPESDGDRAAQNLYSALNDLRHLLRGVRGLSLDLTGDRYRLVPSLDVVFDPRPRRERQ
jgi:tetratricopeptide (TPR) repeat protein